MKLVYWIAEILTDAPCYSLRGRTRKVVADQLKSVDSAEFGPIHKVEVEYYDAFDLLDQCLSEGGIVEHDRSEEK